MATDDSWTRIRAALLSLPIPPGKEGQVERLCHMLVGAKDPDPKAGRVPPNFRNATNPTCAKELKRLAGQAGRLAKLARPPLDRARLGAAARRLTATLRELHQPTILALADAGFLGGERLALLGIAGRIAQAREGASEDELWLLRYAADCAGRSREGPTGGAHCKSRPINQRVRVIVRILYDQFYNLTGRRPTITVNPSHLNSPASGAFLYLVRQVLSALAISASAEAAIRTELKGRPVHGRARRGSAKI
jgi:hypothetical protein